MAGGIQASGSFRRIFNSSNSSQTQETFTVYRQSQETSKSGWLFKQGGVIKSWHKRWFVIRGDQIFYYSGQDENKQMGSIFLPGNKVVESPMNPNEQDKYPFEIQPGPDKSRITLTHETYPLQAGSDDERKAWVQAIKKVMYGDKGGAIFGQSLRETMAYEARTSNRKVPRIVEMCVEFLLKNGVEVEGIFRLAGRSVIIKQLKEVYDSGENVDFLMPEVDIHSVASLLKLYLRELPEPIVPRQFYEPVMSIVQRDLQVNPDRAMNTLQALLTHIPKFNYNLIQYLTHFLKEISNKSDVNKMTAMNLATVFVHCMIRPEDEDPALLMGTANGRTQVTFIFITEWEKLFKMEYNAAGTAVKVGTLLDIDVTGDRVKVFNPDTSTRSESTASNEILDSVLTSESNDVPEPMLMPAVNMLVSPCTSSESSNDVSITRGGSDDGYDTIDNERTTDNTNNLYATINELDPLSSVNLTTDLEHEEIKLTERAQPPIPARPAPLPPKSLSSDNLLAEVESSLPPKALLRSKSSGSAPKPRPRKVSGASISKERGGDDTKSRSIGESGSFSAAPPTPPKPKSASFSGYHAPSIPEKPLPARPAPKPPVRAPVTAENPCEEIQEVKTNYSMSSGASVESLNRENNNESRGSSISLDDLGDDENLNQIININTEGFDHSELQDFISKLKTELLDQQTRARELFSKMRGNYKQQLQDMAMKLDKEKVATAEAVERVISLQSQLQSYSMKYGNMD